MARNALRWRVNDLADKADVNWARVQVMERADGVPKVSDELLGRVVSTFEAHGIVFAQQDGMDGVFLRSSMEDEAPAQE